MEFLHLLGPFLAAASPPPGGATPPPAAASAPDILASLPSFFHPLLHADADVPCCCCLPILAAAGDGAPPPRPSTCFWSASISCWSSRYLAFMLSSSNLSVLMSFFAAAHPSWNDCGVPSSSCRRVVGIAGAASAPGAEDDDLSAAEELASALLILTCSVKSTCTTTRSGSLSFCAACMHASNDSFWQSITLHSLFLSCSVSVGCACKSIDRH
ncbi:Os02g0568100 [Oryza sativa Japonica Group]|uniref:Os02g0568100 protein n=2 Tax=Oryza sativa subsp. japonica TaxID=39947 RepID=Q0E092_ORYSJ|nr:hypothetical protein EE612_011880 [Oryza sativa]BAF09096.1 Os02g0568100 [Oryza sativa Japonica Group]BAS79326.1 Os02g0568100 [Oryza sativa Japonica Group]|eukprot:NP_001047182.1 Os02g0568100 [Oryza sativa Japonica Group]